MSMKKITPFSEEQSHLGGMDIDNSFDRIVMEGELVVSRSEEGLRKLQQFLAFLKDIEKTLCDDLERKTLPKHEYIVPPVEKDNPFK